MTDPTEAPLPAITLDVEYRMVQTALPFVPMLMHESPKPTHPSETRYHEMRMTVAHLQALLAALPEDTLYAVLHPVLAKLQTAAWRHIVGAGEP